MRHWYTVFFSLVEIGLLFGILQLRNYNNTEARQNHWDYIVKKECQLETTAPPLLPSLCFKYKACKFQVHEHSDIGIFSFPGASDVWFSLNGTTYQNNSIVILEEISEGGDALLCITNQTDCCYHPPKGNWVFPNGTRVPSRTNRTWDFFRTRGPMVVRMNRKRGVVEGIYHCEIPDTMNATQTIYIGVYSASTGEWSILL